MSRQFKEYFGLNLDAYIKPEAEFINRIEKKKCPRFPNFNGVLFCVFFGKDPGDLKNYVTKRNKDKKEERNVAQDYLKKATDNYQQMLLAIGE